MERKRLENYIELYKNEKMGRREKKITMIVVYRFWKYYDDKNLGKKIHRFGKIKKPLPLALEICI